MQLSQMTATRGQTTPTRDQALHDPDKTQNQPKRPEHDQLLLQASLPPDKAATFGSLLAMEGQCFNPDDVLEAVQSNRDLSSALRYLSHSCPICAEQLSFSKMVTMTHCSCSFCETCFKTYFSAAIREKSIDKLVCPLCSQPEIRGCGGWEQSMDYFNLLDTQIRHHLGPQSHQLFQEKLRDRALQEMPNFCWCAHCSFGVLHEAEQLMMKCPNCKKTTCSKCRSAWAPQHQGVSCEEFKRWQLHNEPERRTLQLLSRSHIECPNCRLLFHLSRGGCLHFRCSQCQHHFCGSCSQTFSLGASCSFSASCSAKGLHAHHPRNCLYHLRDWSSSRLLQLLQFYRVSPSWPSADFPEAAGGACPVLQLPEENSPMEEACSRPSARNQGGLCQLHYKEHLVDQVQQNLLDPVVLFSRSELEAELQRWCIAAPKQEAQEEEPLFMQRLLLVSGAVTLNWTR